MPRFQTVRRRARFTAQGFSQDAMLRIGEAARSSIAARIQSGLNVDDVSAKPLRPGYAKQKSRKGKPAVRDWTFTGRTLRSMKVLWVAVNRASIGFTDAVSNMRAFFNNRRERQFGVSPRDHHALAAAVRAEAKGAVRTERVA